MKRKSRLLVALSALALLGAATPAFAQNGRGERATPSDRQAPGRVGARVDNRGDQGQRQWQNGGQRQQGQREQGERDRGQREQAQRNDGQRGGDRQWQGQNRPPQQAQRRDGNDQRNWRNDNRGAGDNRNFGQNRPDNRRDNRNFGQNRPDNRNWSDNRPRDDRRFAGWNGRDDRRDYNRYEPNRRAYAAIPYGRYFGRNYGSIASRYYNRNYIYYSSRAWPSWNRPWRVGYALPYSMRCSQLPYDLYYELPPPPYGYDYVMCGYDILLVGYDSRIVIDAIFPW